MKYIDQPTVHQIVKDRSKADIDAVNNYIDGLHGVVISFELIRCGLSRPYGDSLDEYRIFAHQPNSLTTGAPNLRTFTREEIAALAKVVIGGWSDDAGGWGRHLVALVPEINPCGLQEFQNRTDGAPPRHCCWRITLRTPWCD